MPIIATAIVSAGVATVQAISGTKNAKLKREYEANLAALNQMNKAKLEKDLKAAKTKEERQNILAETLGQVTRARITGIEQQKLESQKTINKLIIIGSITLALIIGGLIIIKAKKK